MRPEDDDGIPPGRPPTVLVWKGQRVDEMTHDELLAAFRELAEMYKDAARPHHQRYPLL